MLPHIDWTISITNLFTWLSGIAVFAYTMGKITTVLTQHDQEIDELRAAQLRHQEETSRKFDAVTQTAQHFLELMVQQGRTIPNETSQAKSRG